MAKREYQNAYASVTEVLNVLRKIGLENWFLYNTAQFCKQKSERGKLIGTQIHDGIHSYIQTGRAEIPTHYGEEVKTALMSFIKFRNDHPEISLTNSEIPLTSERYKFNGTLDCLAEDSNKEIVLFDWKTSECKKKEQPPVYDEYLYQVSAYVKLHNERCAPTIKEAYILVLAKDQVAYTLIKLTEQIIDDCFNKVFLPALEIYYYQKELIPIRKELENEKVFA